MSDSRPVAIGMRDQLVAGLGDEAGQARRPRSRRRAPGAVGKVEVGQRHVAVGGEADHHAAGLLVGLQLAGEVGGAGRPAGGRRRPPRSSTRRRHAGGAALGHHDTVRAEAGRRPDDGAEVARVGDGVQRDDERPARRRRRPGRAGRRDGRTRTPAPGPRLLGAPRRSVIRSSSTRATSSNEMPRSAATRKTSRSRPSRSVPSATYTALTGISARSASTTALRPTTQSGVARRGPLPARRGVADLLRALALLVGDVALAVLGLGGRPTAFEARDGAGHRSPRSGCPCRSS